jgi:LPPG:FO 2-phospho-L-lactate transferase
VWPMSDHAVQTYIKTSSKLIDFQTYFVRLKAAPVATGFEYRGAQNAPASPGAIAALEHPRLGAIIITPSNPWLSIDPILSLSEIKSRIGNSAAPVVAISPIVGGRAIKGPTAKIMQELNLAASALAVAEHYQDIIDGFIIDAQDEQYRDAIEALGIKVGVSQTVMNTLQDKIALAQFTLDFADQLREARPS